MRGRDGMTGELRRSGRAWKNLVVEYGEAVYCRAAVASGLLPKLFGWLVSWAQCTHRQHSHHDNRRCGANCRFFEGCTLKESGMLTPEVPRRRRATRADMTKYGVTVGCAVCSDLAVHSKNHKSLTRMSVGLGFGEQVEHDPEGHERFASAPTQARCGN